MVLSLERTGLIEEVIKKKSFGSRDFAFKYIFSFA